MGWSPRAAATMSSRAVAICAPRVRRRGRLREELAGVPKTRVAFRGAECGDTGRPELPDGERGRDRALAGGTPQVPCGGVSDQPAAAEGVACTGNVEHTPANC